MADGKPNPEDEIKAKHPEAKELLTIDPKLASIQVLPNDAAEGKEPNFPRNLHNAAEMFLKACVIHSRAIHRPISDAVLCSSRLPSPVLPCPVR